MRKTIAAAIFLCLLCPFAKAQTPMKLNKENLVVREWKTDAKTNKRILDHVTVYGADGKKIEETEYGLNGQKWRKRYEYGQNGKCSKEYVYDGKNRLSSYKTYEYNEYGRKKVQWNYDASGHLVSMKHFEYTTADEE